MFVSAQEMVFEDGSENFNWNIILVAFEIQCDFLMAAKSSQHILSHSSSVLQLCFEKYGCLEKTSGFRTSMKRSKIP